METPSSIFETLFEKIQALGLTTYELSKLKALEKITIVSTSLVSRLFVVLVFFIFALILSFGIALYLGEITGEVYYGFFIVAAFYLVAGIVFYFFLHKWIRKPLSNSIISQALQ